MKERLKQIRREQKMTQSDFSHELGVTRTAYAKYENGLVTPSDTLIQLLCKNFHVNEEWLRTGKGDMHAQTENNILDEVAQQYKLSPEQKEMLQIIMSFPDDTRQKLAVALISLCRAMANAEKENRHKMDISDRRTIINRELDAEEASSKEM